MKFLTKTQCTSGNIVLQAPSLDSARTVSYLKSIIGLFLLSKRYTCIVLQCCCDENVPWIHETTPRVIIHRAGVKRIVFSNSIVLILSSTLPHKTNSCNTQSCHLMLPQDYRNLFYSVLNRLKFYSCNERILHILMWKNVEFMLRCRVYPPRDYKLNKSYTFRN